MLQSRFGISIKTLQNFEELLAAELRELGATDINIARRIVHCRGDLEFVYRANYCLRTALRVLIPLASFNIKKADDIYDKAKKIDWTEFLEVDQTFAIDPNVQSSLYQHGHYASLKLKDAIADVFTAKYNRRPNVDSDSPDMLFHLHINEDSVSISLDSSGQSLNRRGYRVSGGVSPLNEVLAAGLVLSTGWNGTEDFYDAMCGSATLALEANMIAANIPAGYLRNEFGFMTWKNFDKPLWLEVKDECDSHIKDYDGNIYATDNDHSQIRIAASNIKEADMQDDINLGQLDFFDLMPQSEKGTILINPPYGERIEQEDINELYKAIGDHLKKNWKGHTCWIISSNAGAIKSIGLKPSKKISFINGTLPCTLMRFDLYAGTHKDFVIAKKS